MAKIDIFLVLVMVFHLQILFEKNANPAFGIFFACFWVPIGSLVASNVQCDFGCVPY